MTLRFDPRTHVYSVDNAPVPSVTGIMRSLSLVSDYAFAEAHHRFRGTCVHHCAALIDAGGIIDDVSAPPHLQQVRKDILEGFLPAFRNFKARTGFQGATWEMSLVDPEVGYGGTFDAVGEMGGDIVLLDIKSGSVPLLVPVQMALYWLLILRGNPVNPNHPGLGWLQEVVKSGRPIKRMALQLTKEGKDRLITHTSRRGEEPEDFSSDRWLQVALSVLEVYKTRERFGMLGKEQNGNQRTGGY